MKTREEKENEKKVEREQGKSSQEERMGELGRALTVCSESPPTQKCSMSPFNPSHL